MRFVVALFCAVLLTAGGAAWSYPGDLDLDSFTDDHPEGKKNSEGQAKADKELSPKEQNTKTEEKAKRAEGRAVKAEQDVIVLENKPVNPEEFLCHSSKEYIETLAFLRQTKTILLTETTARQVADQVSKNCDGSAKRFSQILILFKTVGLSDKRSLELALRFSQQSAEVQQNFLEIFSASFLAEFFDYDYPTAVAIAFELSKNFKGDPKNAREDFLALVQFCKSKKDLDLPQQMCAYFSEKMASLSQYHPTGIREPFFKLYSKFREDPMFKLDMKKALTMSYNILRFGARAPDNFFAGYDYALSRAGLALGHDKALEFGLKMARRSFRGHSPPVIPPGSKVVPRASLH